MAEPLRWASSIVPVKGVFAAAALTTLMVGCAHIERYHLDRQVVPKAETTPVPSDDDAADDPAIWVSATNPAESLVIGTDKGSGLLSYTLDGQQFQYLPEGRVNNVDIRQQPWGVQDMSIVVATQRGPSRLVLFTLDHQTRKLEFRARHETEILEPYGICLYQDADDIPYIIANGKDGTFVQYSIDQDYSIQVARRWQVASQPEGCVANDQTNVLYVGEEAAGIWKLDVRPNEPANLTSVDTIASGNLVADVEGLALYHGSDTTYLVASSQGDNSFAVYDTATDQYQFSFHVVGNESIDGASETDGLAITHHPLPGYPDGLLVVQDGFNLLPKEKQNFKLVSWQDVMRTAN